MTAIVIQNLTKKYNEVVAIDDLSITIAANQIFGLVGPDGAGKTSLFQILCGILTPTRGKVSIFGIDVIKEPEKLKQELGYMPQKFALYSDLTVSENLDFFADLFNTPLRGLYQRKRELLKFADLAQFEDRLAGNLSGGMKQKLALCCALIHTPRLLILDEPTTGVDPVSRYEFWKMILPLPQEGTTVIVSTAYMDEAAKCNRVALVNLGKILQIGSPAELKAPLQGKIFEIRGAHLWEIQEKLSSLDWLVEVQVFGDRLHAEIAIELESAAGKRRLEDVLAGWGYQTKVTVIQPSLEDVFVGLMTGKSSPTII
jgi:ABC-2 type transport system ATP-binding protein